MCIRDSACVAQNLREEATLKGNEESVTLILDQVERIKNILESLMAYSHGSNTEIDIEEHNLSFVVDEAINLVGFTHKDKKVCISKSLDESAMLVGDRNHIIQVFVNLLANAIDASDKGGSIDVICKQQNEGSEVKIIDYGCGITDSNKENLFEPFFTTKKVGKGTGLGLHVVYRIIQDHNGKIKVESKVNSGTTVTVWLPKFLQKANGEIQT